MVPTEWRQIAEKVCQSITINIDTVFWILVLAILKALLSKP